jgi:pimeloyl-ACP methyl ester carboxylesterase
LNREVVLVPGLWMPSAAMGLLAARLARDGYSTRVFAYRGRSSPDANVERLRGFVRQWLEGRPGHFIGHSLGGVLILEMLSRHPEIPAASALLIGSPVRGCHAGRRFALARIGRWMMGAARPLWEEREARWQRPEPLGVIAGTQPLGLGRALGRLSGPNDGVVRVAETEVQGMRDRVLVPLGHSALIVARRVALLAERFMAQGRFE